MADVVKLCSSKPAGSVNVKSFGKLTNRKLLVLDAVSKLFHDAEDKLDVGDVFLSLQDTFAEEAIHGA